MLPATDIKEGFLEKTFLSASAEELIRELGRQMRKGDVAYIGEVQFEFHLRLLLSRAEGFLASIWETM